MSREQRATQRKINQSRKKLSTVSKGYPSANEGHDGQETIRWVDGKGLFYFVKYNGTWYSNQFNQAPTINDPKSYADNNLIYADGSKDFTGNQSHGGNNISGVNNLSGASVNTTGNIVAAGNLDVDGATTLDQTTIDTTDGAFAVSGANPISLTTSGGSNPVTINSGGTLDVDATIVDVNAGQNHTTNVGRAYILNGQQSMTTTGSADMLTQATGTSNDALTIQNTNSHNSSFTGLHLKTDSGTVSSNSACFNKILIECNNVATKSADYGVDIASSNQIRLRAGNTQPSSGSGVVTGMLLRATGNLQIGGGTDDITADGSTPLRTIIDGVLETPSLYRPENSVIVTDIGTLSSVNNTASGVHTEFQAIETSQLMRNFTYKKEGTVANGNSLQIVTSSNQDDTDGTVWLVTVNFKVGTRDGITIGYCFKNGGQRHDPEDIGYVVRQYQETTGGFPTSTSVGQINWGPGSGVGIQWINNSGSSATVKASAQRIQSGNDFS